MSLKWAIAGLVIMACLMVFMLVFLISLLMGVEIVPVSWHWPIIIGSTAISVVGISWASWNLWRIFR